MLIEKFNIDRMKSVTNSVIKPTIVRKMFVMPSRLTEKLTFIDCCSRSTVESSKKFTEASFLLSCNLDAIEVEPRRLVEEPPTIRTRKVV